MTRNSLRSLLTATLAMVFLPQSGALAEIGLDKVNTTERDWVEEREFDLDPMLHARELQTIVLDLEDRSASRSRGRVQTNTVRFLVEESRKFSFCIGENDPHLLRIRVNELKSQGNGNGNGKGGRIVFKHKRGQTCRLVKLDPGRYELSIQHDSASVPSGGKKAFVYDPESPSLLGSDASSGIPKAMSFTASNGGFVSGASNANIANANATNVGRRETWEIAPFPNTSGYTLTQNNTDIPLQIDARVANVQPNLGPVYIYTQSIGTNPQFVEFTIQQQSGWAFTMDAWVTTNLSGGGGITTYGAVILDGSNQLVQRQNQVREPLNATLKIFDCSGGCDNSKLNLAAGEVALFSSCDYKGEGAAAITSIGQFVDLNTDLSGQTVRSIRLGPGTFIELFDEDFFGGPPLGYSEDQSCLSAPQVVRSFKVTTDARTFVIDTDQCINCTLDGIDLSGATLDSGVFSYSTFANSNLQNTGFASAIMNNVDLSGADMSGASFDQANLNGATINGGKLPNADLSGADLSDASIRGLSATDMSGADFSGDAILHCTSFRSSDLSEAIFDPDPEILRDFSCRVDLSQAKLTFTLFDAADWRYFDLTGSTMEDVPDVLSTSDAPLDLSGAVLSGVRWLARKQLDSVNLGCYPTGQDQQTVCPSPSGDANCAELEGTELTSASLQNACMSGATLSGALLNFVNLDGADLSQAKLVALDQSQPATIEGAFMRNVDLSSANLTGIDASSVNFYSGIGGAATAQGAQAQGAQFQNAYLAGANFSGSFLQGANFSGSVLVGADFKLADVSTENTAIPTRTSFDNAFLQGADFGNQQVATTNGAAFGNSYWDLSGAETLNVRLPLENLSFRGYWKQGTCNNNPTTLCQASSDCGGGLCTFVDSSGVCGSGGLSCGDDGDCSGGDVCIAQPECVAAQYNQASVTPPTDDSNICPHTDPGACENWESTVIPITAAVPPTATAPSLPVSAGAAVQCTETDFDWLF